MADAVELDPGTYSGTYKVIGGAPALDFANLVSYRGTEREHDWLRPATNAARWARTLDLPAPGRSGTAELRELRELIAEVFLSIADGQPPDPAALTSIGDRATDALRRRKLIFEHSTQLGRWVNDHPTLLGEIARNAAELLTSEHLLPRITACNECRWLFLDTTRNRSRRWCDPADCGNRTRQRRHYLRTTTD